MKTTVIWSHLLGAKVALHIHHRAGLDGRYVVARLWPGEDTGGWACVALWPVGDTPHDLPTLRLDAQGAPVVQRAGVVTTLHPLIGMPCECVEVAA